MIAADPTCRLSDDGRFYLIDGDPYARVTTIISTIASPGLDKWRRKVGYDEADQIARTATGLGTRVHAAIEAYNLAPDRFRMDQIDDDLEPYLFAYATWFQGNVLEVISAEKLLWSTKHRYAGTMDGLLLLKDQRIVCADWKTSNSVSPHYRLQLSAYLEALDEQEQIRAQGRLVVQLPSRKPRELYVTEFDDHERDWNAFRAANYLYRFEQDHAEDWRIPGVRHA